MSNGSMDAPAEPPAQPAPAKPPARAVPRRRRWLRWTVAGGTAVVVAVAGTAAAAYVKLNGNVKRVEVGAEELGPRPAKIATKALNVLVVGSDQRNGKNAKYGPAVGERTDTIMLAHISPKRDNAMIISFPRDSMVQLPDCKATGGLQGQRAHIGMINESFNFGGIGCTWKTVESLTGIRIDHFVKVDFTGFKSMVDAVGGVEVCIPEPIHDKKALLTLPAGRQLLKGEQALGYVRVRYSLGDGSDIGRIQRQQMFVASMVKKVMSGDTLTDPARLFGFLDAATKSVTTDSGLTTGVIKDLATSAKGMAAGQIRFVTTPWRYSATYPGRVEWTQPQSKALFQMVARDRTLAGSGIKGGQTKVSRSKIQVEVRNGTSRSGLGSQVAVQLEERDYHIYKIGDAPRKPYPKTTIAYSPNGEPGVPTLTRDLLVSTGLAVPRATTPRLILTVGDDWKGLKPIRKNDTDSLKGFDATHDSCAGA
ncbi:LCP family protein [Streptosporangium sp. NPDC004379]|uniref:LCP family protein n=1 Tax=Streptosporangium sp. NPDC004379 TaxID=3366189 RepID=UPI0036821FF3